MKKNKFSKKSSYNHDQDDGHRKIKKQKSLYDRKQYREIDNVLRTRNADKIYNYSDEQY